MQPHIFSQKQVGLPKIKYRLATEGSISRRAREQGSFKKKILSFEPYVAEINQFNRQVQLRSQKAKLAKNKTIKNSFSLNGQKNSLQMKRSLDLEVLRKTKSKRIANKKHTQQLKSIEIQLEKIDQNSTIPHTEYLNIQTKRQSLNQRQTNSLSRRYQGSPKSVKRCEERLKNKVNIVISIYQQTCKKIEQKAEQNHQLGQQYFAKTWRYRKNQILINYFLALPNNRFDMQLAYMQPFLKELKFNNPFFNRISELTAQVLVRFCSIRLLKKSEFLYIEGQPSRHVYIVLWGEFLLKSQTGHSKFAKYAFPGDSISEQLFFASEANTKLRPLLTIPKQHIAHIETAKSLTESAVLFFTEEEYKTLTGDLIANGLKFRKDVVLMGNMMKWCFSKKYNMRPSILC